MSGGKPVSNGKLKLYKEIENLKQQGVTTRFIDNETVELTQGWSGFRRIKSLKEPDEAAIRAWIAADSIPLLEVDPALIDTNQYTGWYKYWTTVSIGNGIGYPPQVGDLDQNGKAEIYGGYADSINFDYETHISEVDTNRNVTLRYKYVPRRGASQQLVDVDRNGLKEIMFQLGDSSFFYEQQSGVSLPTRRKFAHAKYESCGAIGTVETIIEMDNDSLIDFVYRGSDPDTACVTEKTYVAEYQPLENNFKKVWSTQLLPPESGIGGYDVGDYDGDGQMNFSATGLWGQVWILENSGDNDYYTSWKDSIPFVNLFYQTSGDVDGDGKREFFVSATMSNGNWITVYEADSNDHYSPIFLFHLLSGGSLDEPTLMTNDVDGDGKLEFVILSGADLFIFKSDNHNNYRLWYYKLNDAKQSIQFYDFTKDGKKDFIITKSRGTQNGFVYFYSDIFTASGVTSVEDGDNQISVPYLISLEQNYPNPFNASTNFILKISESGFVTLKIFDMLGEEVGTVISKHFTQGSYTIPWNANKLPSGIYFVRMNSGSFNDVRKIVLAK